MTIVILGLICMGFVTWCSALGASASCIIAARADRAVERWQRYRPGLTDTRDCDAMERDAA